MINKERKNKLDLFLTSINLLIDNYECLDLALTHSSYTFENKGSKLENNERLEFLGDAVLKLIASKYLYERFPAYLEGDLTKIRAILVSDNILAQLANNINLGDYLKIGFHEERLGGRTRSSTLACAFEALLGAFYVDGKLDELYEFLTKLLKDEVTKIDNSASKYNAKAMLQEYSQSKSMGLPLYEIIKEEGPAHNKLFKVEVSLNGEVIGTGTGKTKKESHQKSAEMAIKKLGLLKEKQEI